MPIPVISSFSLKGKFPIDERMIFETIEDMKNYSKNFLPDMYFCFVKEDQNLYTYSIENDEDPDTGKWKVFKGEGGSSKTFKFTQPSPSSLWEINHKLDTRVPSSIICFDSNENEIFGDVKYISSSYLTVEYCEPVSGTCFISQ